jgi:hypothetical protein
VIDANVVGLLKHIKHNSSLRKFRIYSIVKKHIFGMIRISLTNLKLPLMIWTDEEFKAEALVFWSKKYKSLNENHPFDIESITYNYVKNNNDFKYKDHVEAGVLVNCLVKYGYIEFTKRENNIRYHSLKKV